MHAQKQAPGTDTTHKRASTLHITWLIARRQIGEAVRDRSTLVMSGFFLAFQTVLVLLSVGPALVDRTQQGLSNAGVLMAFFPPVRRTAAYHARSRHSVCRFRRG